MKEKAVAVLWAVALVGLNGATLWHVGPFQQLFDMEIEPVGDRAPTRVVFKNHGKELTGVRLDVLVRRDGELTVLRTTGIGPASELPYHRSTTAPGSHRVWSIPPTDTASGHTLRSGETLAVTVASLPRARYETLDYTLSTSGGSFTPESAVKHVWLQRLVLCVPPLFFPLFGWYYLRRWLRARAQLALGKRRREAFDARASVNTALIQRYVRTELAIFSGSLASDDDLTVAITADVVTRYRLRGGEVQELVRQRTSVHIARRQI